MKNESSNETVVLVHMLLEYLKLLLSAAYTTRSHRQKRKVFPSFRCCSFVFTCFCIRFFGFIFLLNCRTKIDYFYTSKYVRTVRVTTGLEDFSHDGSPCQYSLMPVRRSEIFWLMDDEINELFLYSHDFRLLPIMIFFAAGSIRCFWPDLKVLKWPACNKGEVDSLFFALKRILEMQNHPDYHPLDFSRYLVFFGVFSCELIFRCVSVLNGAGQNIVPGVIRIRVE